MRHPCPHLITKLHPAFFSSTLSKSCPLAELYTGRSAGGGERGGRQVDREAFSSKSAEGRTGPREHGASSKTVIQINYLAIPQLEAQEVFVDCRCRESLKSHTSEPFSRAGPFCFSILVLEAAPQCSQSQLCGAPPMCKTQRAHSANGGLDPPLAEGIRPCNIPQARPML